MLIHLPLPPKQTQSHKWYNLIFPGVNIHIWSIKSGQQGICRTPGAQTRIQSTVPSLLLVWAFRGWMVGTGEFLLAPAAGHQEQNLKGIAPVAVNPNGLLIRDNLHYAFLTCPDFAPCLPLRSLRPSYRHIDAPHALRSPGLRPNFQVTLIQRALSYCCLHRCFKQILPRYEHYKWSRVLQSVYGLVFIFPQQQTKTNWFIVLGEVTFNTVKTLFIFYKHGFGIFISWQTTADTEILIET